MLKWLQQFGPYPGEGQEPRILFSSPMWVLSSRNTSMWAIFCFHRHQQEAGSKAGQPGLEPVLQCGILVLPTVA